MTYNKRTVERYMDGFRRSDHLQILSCLADDVECDIPWAFHVRGKEEFDRHIQDEGFVGPPEITVTRLTEEDDVVVAEGSVRTQRKDGTFLNLAMCDVFELKDGKIRRLISYLMEAKMNGSGTVYSSFKISPDPQLVQKIQDVVGLYVAPPANAVVFSVDEKSQIQALQRAQPVLPMDFGQPERRTHNYVRHGTLVRPGRSLG